MSLLSHEMQLPISHLNFTFEHCRMSRLLVHVFATCPITFIDELFDVSCDSIQLHWLQPSTISSTRLGILVLLTVGYGTHSNSTVVLQAVPNANNDITITSLIKDQRQERERKHSPLLEEIDYEIQ